jgi:hypothetical protein
VHVYGDGEMKVIIKGESGLPEQVYNVGFKANDRRRVMDVVLNARPNCWLAGTRYMESMRWRRQPS